MDNVRLELCERPLEILMGHRRGIVVGELGRSAQIGVHDACEHCSTAPDRMRVPASHEARPDDERCYS